VVARQDPRGSSDAREAANASSNDGLGSERCLHHSSTARVGARPDQPSPTSGGDGAARTPLARSLSAWRRSSRGVMWEGLRLPETG
jgi:hypothetical protein